MKQCFIMLATIVVYNVTIAQTNPEKYAATITGADLKKQLTIIASAEMEGRETGTEGQRKAAAYIETQFKSIGLLPAASLNGYQQYYPLSKDSMTKAELKINGKSYVYGTDFIASAQTNNNALVKAKRIVFAGYGIEDPLYSDYTGKNIKGKIVLLFTGEPKQNGNSLIAAGKPASDWGNYNANAKKIAIAAKKGAAAVLFINPSMEIFTASAANNAKKTNVFMVRDAATGINAATISHALARTVLGNDRFTGLLAKVKQFEVLNTEIVGTIKAKTIFSYTEFNDTSQSSNVLGYIEGTDKKDEYIILTAHYDHLGKRNKVIYFGADDDGSGTCGVIEMAEAFAKAKAEGNGPRRTIVFMTVSGEEKGLWGSEYYSEHPVFSLDKTSVNLNTDMVGRIDTERTTDDTLNYVYVIGHNKLSSELVTINEGVNKTFTQLQLDYKYDDPNDKNRIYFRSDHYNFARKGIPILFFYDGMLKADYHQPTDTVDKINWELYEKRVRMIFHTAWEIANRADMLKRDIPLN